MTPEAKDPLAGLDVIEWAALEHAYGAADDVPGQLRALCGADARGRQKALHALYGNIFHQGSRYEAAATAVPFLARLAADASLPGRADVVELLASLAIGYDYMHLPGGVDVAGWRREIADSRKKEPGEIRVEYDAWVAEAPDADERGRREFRRALFDYDRDLRAAEAELRAYEAVRQQVPALCALLDDGDPAVRAATAYLLAWFPEEATRTLPHLLRLLDHETNAAVTATTLIAGGLLGDTALIDRLRPYLANGEPTVRWATATALARVGATRAEPTVGPRVLAELAAVATDPPEPGPPGMPFHEGDLRSYAAATLALLADRYPTEALDAVTDALVGTTGLTSASITAVALRLAFGSQRLDRLPAFADLERRQRRLVRVLASLDAATWLLLNFREVPRAWGLPDDRAAIRTYAGLPTK